MRHLDFALSALLFVSACNNHTGGLASGGTLLLSGERPGAGFGSSGDLPGDLNGDGFGDVAVGAPGDSLEQIESGTVYVYPGSAAGPAAVPGTRFVGGVGDHFGRSVAGVGDLNGDGLEDLAVTADDSVYVFFGRAGGWAGTRASDTADIIIGGNASGTNSSGLVVSSAGDLDQNGALDLAVGSPSAGVVYVFLNGVSLPNAARLLTSQADVTIRGEADDADFGAALAALGDVNGQNAGLVSRFGDDFAVGAPGSGRVYVFLGRAGFPRGVFQTKTLASQALRGIASGDRFGAAVAGLGDFDGDGFGDMAVGAPGNGSGRVFVHFGQSIRGPGAFEPLTLTGETPGDEFGASVAGTLPVGISGTFPVFAGAPGNAFGGSQAGSAYRISRAIFASGVALYGLEGSASFADQRIRSPFSGYGGQGRFGSLVRAGTDVNGDGNADLWVGSPGVSSAGEAAGAAEALW